MKIDLIKEQLLRITPKLSSDELFPSIEEEFAPCKKYFNGYILNAGSGSRDISNMCNGVIINQDLSNGYHNKNTHIFSPLHMIPFRDGFFDTIICNAVLEHVENPHEVMKEFNRVCKIDGILILAIPFMQPEHLDPRDFQRYTIDGIKKIAIDSGFDVIQVENIHSVYSTIGWIIFEWLESKNTIEHFFLKFLLYPYIKYKCHHSHYKVQSIASVYRLIGKKSRDLN
ncbi:class I SAM-dependent methyltransferase [uncultured Methanospirillum sp.]|uniref:class I SAM-dependent methyltransferase n=1 Tax=uncultured Methanospirillum sp. TaxID=262503 RepID=UPI0029C8FB9B|nr:class I SAM-dependent methyltransferase [uncultured Methanospirillum sp.]